MLVLVGVLGRLRAAEGVGVGDLALIQSDCSTLDYAAHEERVGVGGLVMVRSNCSTLYCVP